MLTPQDYSTGILKVLRIPHENLVDLYVIPNYKNFFKGCVDRHFGLFKNEDYTKLQFTLEAVPVDPVKYPVGVRLSCRSYVQGIYPNLVVKEESALGVDVDVIEVNDFPGPEDDPINVLLDLPTGKQIEPDAFADDYLSSYNKYVNYMKRNYNSKRYEYVLSDLSDFEKIYPNTVDVNEWLSKNTEKFHVPFSEYFHDFEGRLSLGILPMRYMDKRTKADQSLLAGYRIRKDVDTVQRSAVIVENEVRNYYRKERFTETKHNGMASLAISKASQVKYSKMIGIKFYDLHENAQFVVDSLFEQSNKKGTLVAHFRMRKVGEDCSGSR